MLNINIYLKIDIPDGVDMKVCIAYESKYGNGKTCAEYLEKMMRAKGSHTQIYSIRDISPKSIPKADLYVFSTPTHIGGPTWKMKRFLKKLDIKQEGAKYTLMTTCMDENNKSLEKMTELIEPHGLTKATDGIKIKVKGMKGPLEDDYQDRIKSLVLDIVQK
jgi:flavorubredoxin